MAVRNLIASQEIL